MRSVDIQITERCSMKCLDCSNLMHLYQHPINFDSDDIKSWVDGFCRNIDRVGEARVIGGEPFMNKNAAELVRHCAEKPQFQRVTIFTNGTISLTQKQLDLMRHPKVVFLITQLRGLKRSMKAFKRPQGQRYSLRVAEGQWLDRLGISYPSRTGRSAQKEFFKPAAATSCSRFAGQFVRCSWAMLWAWSFHGFWEDMSTSCRKEVRDELGRFMNDLPFLKGCDFCPGGWMIRNYSGRRPKSRYLPKAGDNQIKRSFDSVRSTEILPGVLWSF